MNGNCCDILRFSWNMKWRICMNVKFLTATMQEWWMLLCKWLYVKDRYKLNKWNSIWLWFLDCMMNGIYEIEHEHAAIHSWESCCEWTFCDDIELGGIKCRMRGERLTRTNCELSKMRKQTNHLLRKWNSIYFYDTTFTPPSFDTYISIILSASFKTLKHYWFFFEPCADAEISFYRCPTGITHRCETVTWRTRFFL